MAQSGREIDLAVVLHALWRRKFTTGLIFVGVLAATLMAYRSLPRTYESEARLFLRIGRENAAVDSTSTMGQAPIIAIPQSRKEEINSVVEMFSSQSVLNQVVDTLGPELILAETFDQEEAAAGLAVPPSPVSKFAAWAKTALATPKLAERDAAIEKLKGSLSVQPFNDSNVLRVTYSSGSPKLSQRVVDQLIDAYLKEHVRIHRTPGAYEFLADQTAQLRKTLEQAEDELYALKEETSLISVIKQRDALVEQAAALERQQMAAETTLASTGAAVAKIGSKRSQMKTEKVLGTTQGIANAAADAMRGELYRLEIREQELLSKYTTEHHEVKQLREQIAQAQAILAQEEKSRPQTTVGPNRLHEEAELALLSREPVLASTQAEAATLTGQLTTIRERLRKLNGDQQRIEELERQVAIYDAAYRDFAVNVERSRVDEALRAQQISNISVVQPASWAPRPISPHLTVMLLAGFCLASFLSVVVAIASLLSDTKIHSGDDLEQRLELPALASIPRINHPQNIIHERN